MSKNKQIQSNQQSILKRSLLTGFIGGILSGSFSIFMYYFNFSEVTPRSYVVTNWINNDWANGWIGDIMSIFIIGLLSIFVALIYYVLFKKIYAMWLGAFYGVLIWFFIFVIVQPLYSNMEKVTNLSQDTIISTLCLFLLYGIFIGYSISYDYFDTIILEDEGSQ